MKRSISDVVGSWQLQYPRLVPKRPKRQDVQSSVPHTYPPLSETSHRSQASSSQSPALTEEALNQSQQQSAEEPLFSIQHWLKDYSADCYFDGMPAPPTPRSAYSTNRGRQIVKRHMRASSRTPSPNKKPSPQTYRTQNMSLAGIVVDNLGELPQDIQRGVLDILDIESLENTMSPLGDQMELAAHVTRFLDKSRHSAKQCSLEGDWKFNLFSLISELVSDRVQCHTSEKCESASLVQDIILGC